MATKANSFLDRNVRLDPAMKAGIAATVCSVLIVALALLAMHTLPVGFGGCYPKPPQLLRQSEEPGEWNEDDSTCSRTVQLSSASSRPMRRRSVRGQTARRCVTYLTHGDRAPALSILSGGCDWMGARADEVACAVAVGVGGKNELAA